VHIAATSAPAGAVCMWTRENGAGSGWSQHMRGPTQPRKQGGCGVRELSALGAGARIPSDASVQDRTSGRQRVPKKMHRIKVSLRGGHLRGFSQAMRSRHVVFCPILILAIAAL